MSTTTTPIDPIQAAIAAAQASAQNAVTTQANAVAPLAGGGTAGALVPGAKLTMEQLAGGLNVDHWIGVKEMCFTFGQSKTAVTSDIIVDIDMTAVQPSMGVKFGNPAVYFKTYDMVTEARGGMSWQEALRKAQMADPNVKPYRSVDLPMTVVEAIAITKGKDVTVLAEPGETLGHSLSTTNWGNWESFYKQMQKLGLAGETVRVVLSYEQRKNAKNNVWGVIKFTYSPVN